MFGVSSVWVHAMQFELHNCDKIIIGMNFNGITTKVLRLLMLLLLLLSTGINDTASPAAVATNRASCVLLA